MDGNELADLTQRLREASGEWINLTRVAGAVHATSVVMGFTLDDDARQLDELANALEKIVVALRVEAERLGGR